MDLPCLELRLELRGFAWPGRVKGKVGPPRSATARGVGRSTTPLKTLGRGAGTMDNFSCKLSICQHGKNHKKVGQLWTIDNGPYVQFHVNFPNYGQLDWFCWENYRKIPYFSWENLAGFWLRFSLKSTH